MHPGRDVLGHSMHWGNRSGPHPIEVRRDRDDGQEVEPRSRERARSPLPYNDGHVGVALPFVNPAATTSGRGAL
jgi:hypothetical protein